MSVCGPESKERPRGALAHVQGLFGGPTQPSAPLAAFVPARLLRSGCGLSPNSTLEKPETRLGSLLARRWAERGKAHGQLPTPLLLPHRERPSQPNQGPVVSAPRASPSAHGPCWVCPFPHPSKGETRLPRQKLGRAQEAGPALGAPLPGDSTPPQRPPPLTARPCPPAQIQSPPLLCPRLPRLGWPSRLRKPGPVLSALRLGWQTALPSLGSVPPRVERCPQTWGLQPGAGQMGLPGLPSPDSRAKPQPGVLPSWLPFPACPQEVKGQGRLRLTPVTEVRCFPASPQKVSCSPVPLLSGEPGSQT